MTSNFIIEIVFPAHSLCVVFFPTLLLVLSIHPSLIWIQEFIFSPHPKGVTEGRLEIMINYSQAFIPGSYQVTDPKENVDRKKST